MSIFGRKKDTEPVDDPVPTPSDSDSEQFFREVDIEFLIHELKDPVAIIETGVRTLLERTEKYGPLTAKQQRTLQRTLRNSQKARAMLSNLLEIGRSQSGCFLVTRFKPARTAYQALCDAVETVEWRIFEKFCQFESQDEALAFLAGRGIRLTMDSALVHVEVVQDEIKFGQILGNLIKNALHHRRDRLDISMECHGDALCVDVVDDGPGIDEQHHQVIFQRYTRLKECSLVPREGHGLGLAGARILARCMGGEIEVFSEKNQGTTFRLTMPMDMSARSR